MTENEIALLFEEVKKVCPSFDPRFFMSDDTNSFHNGFRRSIPESRAQKILCAWHVLRAIKKTGKSKLHNKGSTDRFVKLVREAMKSPTLEHFEEKYKAIIELLNRNNERT
ncbi:hypothetical protein ANCCAN_11719 [Ancylostoma caninum]|uniref:MULE transposase domain-containing protein n=1 Tax=Ancylostoma caninum TaxID=29170 RepID=A0A368GD36_ANCCA|nr:hypothetical protein ANCCAN_11719 [Ancylostoma caninum]